MQTIIKSGVGIFSVNFPEALRYSKILKNVLKIASTTDRLQEPKLNKNNFFLDFCILDTERMTGGIQKDRHPICRTCKKEGLTPHVYQSI